MTAAPTLRACGLSALLLATSLGAQQAPATRPRTAAEDLQLFSQVYNQIRVNHPDSLDSHRLFMSAIQAMVQATDPHSYVIPAARLSPGKEDELRAGRLHPVPIEWAFVGGSAVVANLHAGTAARRADILPGDELVAIDGQPVRAESALELEIELAGPRNSTTTLTFERRQPDGNYARFDRRVRRERRAEETSVPASFLLDPQTAYIRITTFAGDRTSEQMRTVLDRMAGQGARRLVLDLRQNGGGLVNEALEVASEFLPSGTLVYTSESRRANPDTGRVRRVLRTPRTWPIVVLIDDGTASASELVVGALQDHDRALVVGRPSFGKALVMRGFPLSDGSVLVLVVGHLKTPCGRVIQRQYKGITARNYYRLAAADRDTVGRPSCQTRGGRTVYGGGGIYPDVLTPAPPPVPSWQRRVAALDLPVTWAGGYVSEQGARLTTAADLAASPTLDAAALSGFRAFAKERGVEIPDGEEADAQLTHLLVTTVAFTKWGNEGLYLVEARLDPEVRSALKYFEEMEARGIR
jgi:carboxyl-terminal processing protease